MDAVSLRAPLARHALVDTFSPEEARQEIGRIFCPHFLSPRQANAAGFHAVHRASKQRGYSLNFVAYGSEVEIDPGELSSFFLLQIPLAGSAEVRCGTTTALANPGHTASLLSPTLPTRMRWSDGCAKLIVLIEREVMQRQCAELLDRAIDKVEFETAVDLSSLAGRLALDHVNLMLESVESGNAAFGNYLARLGESLSSLLLSSLAHSQRAALDVPARTATSSTVDRAQDWIRANIERDFTVGDIAKAMDVSLRTLQETVRRHNGTTLVQMIEALRLDHFHSLLSGPQNGQSVTELAGLAGLGHLGRAAAAYRRRYGESPSQTLRRRR